MSVRVHTRTRSEIMLNSDVGEVHLPLIITSSQSYLKSCTIQSAMITLQSLICADLVGLVPCAVNEDHPL